MHTLTASAPEVYDAREIARAADVPVSEARALLASGAVETFDGGLVAESEAIRAVTILRQPGTAVVRPSLFQLGRGSRRRTGGPLAASGALHAGILGALVLLASLGNADPSRPAQPDDQMRLIFLSLPGPGGGGGGGGLRQRAPARRAEMKSTSPLRSPIPKERAVRKEPEEPPKPKPQTPPPLPEPTPRPVEPPPPIPKAEPLPPVLAPVASGAADPRDRAGVLKETAPVDGSNGTGGGGGAGTGEGTGIGEGTGPGIGPGSGGGTGGGPYRPGSGITPPSILREVKPDYSEEARRRNLEGDVVLEIVVRRDGSVGSITVLQGLGSGLDQRAVDAVRQWRFRPAQRLGTPVDVIVEVAVEFRLR